MDHGGLFAIIYPLIFLGVPIAIGLLGWVRCRGEPRIAEPLVARRTILLSVLTYTLAFNITFFIQELFLVVPKAFTPGLRPTLYHNNHNWEGTHPLESLFQGTGAAAIFLSGLVFAWLAKRGAGKTEAKRLFVLWMAYNGLFQSLPQFAFAPVAPGRFPGRPKSVSFASTANATASFASGSSPTSASDRTGTGASAVASARMSVLLRAPPPDTSTSATGSCTQRRIPPATDAATNSVRLARRSPSRFA